MQFFPLSLQPAAVHGVAAIGLVAAVLCAAHLGMGWSQRQVDGMKQSLATAEQAVAMDVTQEGAGLVATVSAGPFTWPERHLVDDLTRFMSEQAIVNRLAFRTLSISHTAPSAQAWGMVSLEVVASGAYGDVKNWQGGLLARYPSLAVRSLGLQPLGSSIHADGLEARMTWVLYVRD